MGRNCEQYLILIVSIDGIIRKRKSVLNTIWSVPERKLQSGDPENQLTVNSIKINNDAGYMIRILIPN